MTIAVAEMAAKWVSWTAGELVYMKVAMMAVMMASPWVVMRVSNLVDLKVVLSDNALAVELEHEQVVW